MCFAAVVVAVVVVAVAVVVVVAVAVVDRMWCLQVVCAAYRCIAWVDSSALAVDFKKEKYY